MKINWEPYGKHISCSERGFKENSLTQGTLSFFLSKHFFVGRKRQRVSKRQIGKNFEHEHVGKTLNSADTKESESKNGKQLCCLNSGRIQ